MRVHHLNCGTMCPRGGPLVSRDGDGTIVCHCLLIETDEGLVLVDTGIGQDDLNGTRRTVSPVFRWLSRPLLDARETAWQQVQALGFQPEDVRHIVVTHLDFDHAGGLSDFPHATVHLMGAEYAAAMHPRPLVDRLRYHRSQWAHEPQWVCYEPQGEPWFGFECVRQLQGLPDTILLVPLAGHTPGHCGVAVDLGDRWLLHAGDAYYTHEEVHGRPLEGAPGLTFFGELTQSDAKQRRHNQERLRQLAASNKDKVTVICSHDAGEWARCCAATLTAAP